MQFVYQPLTWAFFLVLVPVLIHLINMMRHRRVQWAPMEFLLASYKKHRRWIWLKQLLLLLARMAAVAAVVAMLAQLVTLDQWANLFGGKVTHHYVALDDSFSMSDRSGGETAFDRAKQVLARLAERAVSQDTTQKFTLVRFSRAGIGAAEGEGMDLAADFTAEVVDGRFGELLEAKRRGFEVTQSSVGALPALEVMKHLVDDAVDENRVVYLVSDFRAPQWQNPAEIREALRDLEKAGAEIHLVNVVKAQHPNLAVVELTPTEATRAAGVPLFVNVKVKNFGTEQATNVQLKIRTHFFDPADYDPANPVAVEPKIDELPTELIERIGPGETVSRKVQVFFPAAGQHVVEAVLPSDPVAADNERFCVIDLPPGEQVLVVDGHPNGTNASFLEKIFRPENNVTTGIVPEVKTAAALRDMPPDELKVYRAVYLLDVDRLDASTIEKLENYVREGGGLAFFLGDEVNFAHYNEALYRDDQGLFPVPLDRMDLLAPAVGEPVPDLDVVDHPVFGIFSGQNNALLAGISIWQYVRVKDGWAPGTDSKVSVIGRLRNRQPVVVERQFGQGRVVAFLTTLAPQWNDLAKGPSIVVIMLQLEAYLAAPQQVDVPRLVGSPIHVAYQAEKYQPDVKFIVPGAKATARKMIAQSAGKAKPDADMLETTLRSLPSDDTQASGTDRAGIYEAWATSTEGNPSVHRYALNVDAAEGDLALADSRQLANGLKPVPFKLHDMDELDYELTDQAGFNWSEMILYALVLLLLGEQLLAYSASYHPVRGGAR